MIDRERLLANLDELDGYLRELCPIAPAQFEQYRMVERKTFSSTSFSTAA